MSSVFKTGDSGTSAIVNAAIAAASNTLNNDQLTTPAQVRAAYYTSPMASQHVNRETEHVYLSPADNKSTLSDKDTIYINDIETLTNEIKNYFYAQNDGKYYYEIYKEYITGKRLSDIISSDGKLIPIYIPANNGAAPNRAVNNQNIPAHLVSAYTKINEFLAECGKDFSANVTITSAITNFKIAEIVDTESGYNAVVLQKNDGGYIIASSYTNQAQAEDIAAITFATEGFLYEGISLGGAASTAVSGTPASLSSNQYYYNQLYDAKNLIVKYAEKAKNEGTSIELNGFSLGGGNILTAYSLTKLENPNLMNYISAVSVYNPYLLYFNGFKRIAGLSEERMEALRSSLSELVGSPAALDQVYWSSGYLQSNGCLRDGELKNGDFLVDLIKDDSKVTIFRTENDMVSTFNDYLIALENRIISVPASHEINSIISPFGENNSGILFDVGDILLYGDEEKDRVSEKINSAIDQSLNNAGNFIDILLFEDGQHGLSVADNAFDEKGDVINEVELKPFNQIFSEATHIEYTGSGYEVDKNYVMESMFTGMLAGGYISEFATFAQYVENNDVDNILSSLGVTEEVLAQIQPGMSSEQVKVLLEKYGVKTVITYADIPDEFSDILNSTGTIIKLDQLIQYLQTHTGDSFNMEEFAAVLADTIISYIKSPFGKELFVDTLADQNPIIQALVNKGLSDQAIMEAISGVLEKYLNDPYYFDEIWQALICIIMGMPEVGINILVKNVLFEEPFILREAMLEGGEFLKDFLDDKVTIELLQEEFGKDNEIIAFLIDYGFSFEEIQNIIIDNLCEALEDDELYTRITNALAQDNKKALLYIAIENPSVLINPMCDALAKAFCSEEGKNLIIKALEESYNEQRSNYEKKVISFVTSCFGEKGSVAYNTAYSLMMSNFTNGYVGDGTKQTLIMMLRASILWGETNDKHDEAYMLSLLNSSPVDFSLISSFAINILELQEDIINDLKKLVQRDASLGRQIVDIFMDSEKENKIDEICNIIKEKTNAEDYPFLYALAAIKTGTYGNDWWSTFTSGFKQYNFGEESSGGRAGGKF